LEHIRSDLGVTPLRLWAIRALPVLALLSSCGLSAYHSPRLLHSGVGERDSITGSRVRILVWNVHKQTDSVFFSDLSTLLDSSDADLALLQEVAIQDTSIAFRMAMHGRAWSLSANLSRVRPAQEIGVATASRIEPIESIAILSRTGEMIVDTRKAALLTRYPTSAETLTIVNAHALNFSPRIAGFRQQIEDIASNLRARPGPAIVAGDFNTWSRRRLRILDSSLADCGLVRVDFGEAERLKKRAFGNALDQIYFTPAHLALDTASIRVHTRVRSSDHFPLEASFLLAAPPNTDRHAPFAPHRPILAP